MNTEPFTVSGTVTGISSRAQFVDDTRTEEEQFFKYGTLIFTSGLNEGREIEVIDFSGDIRRFVMLEPFPFNIELGDEYTAVAGCDRSRSTCVDRFNNIENYRGFPDIPTEQESFETPDAR